MSTAQQLIEAASDGDVMRLERLLDAGADVDAESNGWTPLHAAIEHEMLDCVEALVRRGADVDKRIGGQSPLGHAVDIAIDGTIQTGGAPGDEPTEIVELLLAAGADPADAIDVARAYQNERFVRILECGHTG